jgi:leucyl aminopeptidase
MARFIRLGTESERDSSPVIAIVAQLTADGGSVGREVARPIHGCDLAATVTGEWSQSVGLSAKAHSAATFGQADGTKVVVINLPQEPTTDDWRKFAAAAVRAADERTVSLEFSWSLIAQPAAVAQALAEGAVLGSYAYKKQNIVGEVLVTPVGERPSVAVFDAFVQGLQSGRTIGESVNWAKYLVDLPAGDLSPKSFATRTAEQAEGIENLTVDIWGSSRIEEERLGGLLGVNLGSGRPPRVVFLKYAPPVANAPHVALVGKGITFDSGGLSIKPATGMMTMKTDMSGAAIVMAATLVAARLKLPIQITAIAMLTENMTGDHAMRPGDVLTVRNGMTIEVLNTDAEGRLVLADGLVLASEAQPNVIIDVATLTGAQVVALGDEISGLFATTDELADALISAGAAVGESHWRLPLVDSYESHIESSVADMKNIGKTGAAGSISAALLLRRFVGDTPWAHLDIAGPSYSDAVRGYTTKGATAFSARTLIEYVTRLAR